MTNLIKNMANPFVKSSDSRMPALFIGHGSPMNAIAENSYTHALGELGKSLPKPRAILAVSAHWLTDGTSVQKVERPETIHDFYGFPEELYQVQYPAPGSLETADQVVKLLEHHDSKTDANWGLDHGTWAVLKHMYPDADVPVLQLGINRNLDLKGHLELAHDLKALRDEGILILGSGNITHNLRAVVWEADAKPVAWAQEFDDLIRRAIENRDLSELLAQDASKHSLWKQAHPSIDHYIPLLYAVGASDEKDPIAFPYEGIELGTLSMRAVRLGA